VALALTGSASVRAEPTAAIGAAPPLPQPPPLAYPHDPDTGQRRGADPHRQRVDAARDDGFAAAQEHARQGVQHDAAARLEHTGAVGDRAARAGV
jgi:hypothetical protein